MTGNGRPLVFGIYPGSATGDDAGGVALGPPDVPSKIGDALGELQGRAGRPFVVRAYRLFTDAGGDGFPEETPEGFDRYLGQGRMLDLVAQYHSASGDVDGYCAFLEELIDRHRDRIARLQVGEEPNMTANPVLDGYYPRAAEAIISGVSAAKAKARRGGLTRLAVGINTTPLPGAAAGFLTGLARTGGDRFTRDLDYIGLDFFPDVFRPIPGSRLGSAVGGLLRDHRRRVLASASLGRLPLVITEHGWPTGPGRPPRRQAEILRTVVEVIAGSAGELKITGYTHFSLRDARSAEPGLFSQFGIMTDDYAPKPAFTACRDLISALG